MASSGSDYSPIFEYHDLLMNIKFDFTDAYIEYGNKAKDVKTYYFDEELAQWNM